MHALTFFYLKNVWKPLIKIEQKVKMMASSLELSKDYIMDDVKEFIKEIEVDSKMICLRQAEAQLMTIVILFLGKYSFLYVWNLFFFILTLKVSIHLAK